MILFNKTRAVSLCVAAALCLPVPALATDTSWSEMPGKYWFCEVSVNASTRTFLVTADSWQDALAVAPAIINVSKPDLVVCY